MLLGKKQQGFSMIEMVTVLVLLGVLGAAAFSRFGNTSSYTEAIVQQELLAYFQLTQRVAVAHQDSTTSFTLTRNGDQWDIALQFEQFFSRFRRGCHLSSRIQRRWRFSGSDLANQSFGDTQCSI